MKIGVTFNGLEKVLKQDTKGKIIHSGRVLFSKGKLNSATMSYGYITSFNFKNDEEIYEKIKNLKIKVNKDFRVDCSREGNHNFSSQEIRQNIGEIIYNKGNKVNLDSPKTVVYIDIIDNFCIIGLNSKKLKRDYKVRTSNNSLNASVAYSLLKLSKFNKNKSLLDPFCSDGTILIEAGLMKGKKLYGLCQDTKNASINSKIAKVKINLYQENLSWLDTLFKKDSLDLIISNPIFPSKTKSFNFVEKIIKELFHHSSYILKKNGLILLISPKTDLLKKYAEIYKFKVKEELEIIIGGLDYKVLSFKKYI
ncbi:MAG: THUMP domain-containing protein [Nanoarchaeota archaeon]